MPLSDGFHIALTTPELKALRAKRGDPKRRQHIEDLKQNHDPQWLLPTGADWRFIQHIFDPKRYPHTPPDHHLVWGKGLHRGQFCIIELIAPETLIPLADILDPIDYDQAHDLFFGINERAFRNYFIPFWITEEWHKEGRQSAMTPQQFATFWPALQALRTFLRQTAQANRHLIFTTNYTNAPY